MRRFKVATCMLEETNGKYVEYAEVSQLESDCLSMALRLIGEDENTFSPEVREVMSRWKPKALKALDDSSR